MKFLKKVILFFELLPFANLDKIGHRKFDISKTIPAMRFKLGQIIVDNE